MDTLTCDHCGGAFTRPKSKVGAYCSRSCQAKSRTGQANSHWQGGKTRHPLYGIYREMLNRTTNPRHKRWDDYGGRGITVCDRWRNDFWAFVADMGPRPEGRTPSGRSLWTLDRVDNDRGYSPKNCRWATEAQQRANQRRSTTRKAA